MNANADPTFRPVSASCSVDSFSANESLVAIGKTGDDGARAPLGSRRIHRLENVETHQASFST